MILREEDSGKVIKLSAGDVFQVELRGPGREGYRWHVEGLDPEYVELLSEEIRISSLGKSDSPVWNLWTFRVKKEGLAKIEMYYCRQGEGIGDAKESFRFNLSIE